MDTNQKMYVIYYKFKGERLYRRWSSHFTKKMAVECAINAMKEKSGHKNDYHIVSYFIEYQKWNAIYNGTKFHGKTTCTA